MPETSPAARVRVGYHFTVNLGNYENVKVVVEVEDSPRGSETVAEAYDRIEKFVSDKVSNEVAQAHKA